MHQQIQNTSQRQRLDFFGRCFSSPKDDFVGVVVDLFSEAVLFFLSLVKIFLQTEYLSEQGARFFKPLAFSSVLAHGGFLHAPLCCGGCCWEDARRAIKDRADFVFLVQL